MNNNFHKASFVKRLGAFLIDHVILSIILVPGFLLYYWNDIQQAPERMFDLILILIFIAALAYCLKDIFRGVSIGKWLLGLVVRMNDDSGQIPSLVKLFSRNLLTCVWPIELIALLNSKHNRKLGDVFAGTDVYERAKPK